MTYNICFACNGLLSSISYTKDSTYYLCKQCGCWNKIPRGSYSDIIQGGYHIPSPTDISKSKNKFEGLLIQLESYVGKGCLFDVATGIGGMLALAKDRGWKKYDGNELRTEHIQAAKKHYGIHVRLGHFVIQCIIDQYDVIVFHHGIEHLRNPYLAIHRAIDRLKPNGYIYLTHPCLPESNEFYLRKYADWSESIGCHKYEWTYKSFEYFVNQFRYLKVVNTGCGPKDDKNAVCPIQHWLLRKR